MIQWKNQEDSPKKFLDQKTHPIALHRQVI
jgi:hypothetical protein